MSETRRKILVVDDDPNLRELLHDTLDTIGYDTVVASDGFEALEKLQEHPVDLVITDIRMPGMDGIGLLKKIRRQSPDLPVLFITGVESPDIIGRASPDGFLAKPFRISHMEELIQDALLGKKDQSTLPIKKVMVVDDDDLFREMLSETLSYHGFVPYAVQDADHALQELRRGSVDAVITDIKMPGMDGITLMREIKESHPDLPVVLITAFLSEDEADREAASVSADGFLKKPFEADRIIDLLRDLSPRNLSG